MNREEFLTALAQLVEEGTITQAEAEDLLRQFDGGTITEEDLPASQEEMFAPIFPFEADFWTLLVLSDATISGIDRARMNREARLLGALLDEMGFQTSATGSGRIQLRPGPTSTAAIFENLGAERVAQRLRAQQAAAAARDATIGTDLVLSNLGSRLSDRLLAGRSAAQDAMQVMGQARRRALAEDVLDIFSGEASSRTGRLLFSNRYNDGLRRWQVAMRGAVRSDMLTFAELGKGAPLNQADVRRLVPAMQKQMAHLQRFAEEIAARRQAGNPMSRAQIEARLKMYSGDALSSYYLMAEQDLGEGWVVDYIAVDDDRTCRRCIWAEENGPYLFQRGPRPGADICLGRGHCRCRREPRFAPREYDRLEQQDRFARWSTRSVDEDFVRGETIADLT